MQPMSVTRYRTIVDLQAEGAESPTKLIGDVPDNPEESVHTLYDSVPDFNHAHLHSMDPDYVLAQYSSPRNCEQLPSGQRPHPHMSTKDATLERIMHRRRQQQEEAEAHEWTNPRSTASPSPVSSAAPAQLARQRFDPAMDGGSTATAEGESAGASSPWCVLPDHPLENAAHHRRNNPAQDKDVT